jgi:hypothetical protein
MAAGQAKAQDMCELWSEIGKSKKGQPGKKKTYRQKNRNATEQV